jgi:hypothetical protein
VDDRHPGTDEGIQHSDEARQRSYEIEDRRWSTQHQIRDWIWLGIMILAYCAWTLFVYFLEPGLR